MKVLMLNTYDEGGGAARAACRLNDGMRSRGIESRLLVRFRSTNGREILPERSLVGWVAPRLRLLLDSLPVKCYPRRRTNNFWPAWLPDDLARKAIRMDPDIVHLHWITAGMMRIETLKKFNKPLVWTMHDSWPFTGGCNVPLECERYRRMCGACPLLESTRETDISRWIWRRKTEAWRGVNLTVVTPSRWLAKKAGESSIFSGIRIEVIPNGVDLDLFSPVEKHAARNTLGLAPDKKLILFGAFFSTNDPNKGFSMLVQALRRMSADGWGDKAELVVFGDPKPARTPQLGMRARFLGKLHDDKRIALLYAAADVFVAPSIQENLPYTVMESMACGTPCVAFDQGGMPDLIDHERTGYLARSFESYDLARGIVRILEDENHRAELSLQARRKILREFALERVTERYLALYREVAGRGRPL